jgi:hypothetical protein
VAPLFIWGASANGPGGLVIQNLHVLAVVAVTLFLAMSDWRPWPFTRARELETA